MTSEVLRSQPIRVLDLFAGCGGLTEGFHQYRPTGVDEPVFRSVGAVEWDPAAAATYAMNFGAESDRRGLLDPPEIYQRDIVHWQPRWKPGEIEVVVGGPPCQGFSSLNRGKVGAERNQLWEEFIRIVVAVQPDVFVIENVDRFVRSPEFANLKDRMGNGDLRNYDLVAAPGAKDSDSPTDRARRYLLNAADYGAPQARRRSIVIGVRTDGASQPERMRYPERTHAKVGPTRHEGLTGLVVPAAERAWLTVDSLFRETAKMQSAGSDLPDRRRKVDLFEGGYSGRGPYTTAELHITRNPERLSLARYAAIPMGGNRKDLRGRYLCRFGDGEEVILEKQGQYRGSDGSLVIPGRYSKVIDGSVTATQYGIGAEKLAGNSTPGISRRSRSEAFSVFVSDRDKRRSATIEYLSTPSWDAHDTGSGDVMGRLREGAPSVTVRTEFFKPEKGRYLHPTVDRPITHYEAALLQGFPPTFKWCGSKTEIARQIGNAVPIPLGRKIAEAIYRYLRPSEQPGCPVPGLVDFRN